MIKSITNHPTRPAANNAKMPIPNNTNRATTKSTNHAPSKNINHPTNAHRSSEPPGSDIPGGSLKSTNQNDRAGPTATRTGGGATTTAPSQEKDKAKEWIPGSLPSWVPLFASYERLGATLNLPHSTVTADTWGLVDLSDDDVFKEWMWAVNASRAAARLPPYDDAAMSRHYAALPAPSPYPPALEGMLWPKWLSVRVHPAHSPDKGATHGNDDERASHHELVSASVARTYALRLRMSHWIHGLSNAERAMLLGRARREMLAHGGIALADLGPHAAAYTALREYRARRAVIVHDLIWGFAVDDAHNAQKWYTGFRSHTSRIGKDPWGPVPDSGLYSMFGVYSYSDEDSHRPRQTWRGARRTAAWRSFFEDEAAAKNAKFKDQPMWRDRPGITNFRAVTDEADEPPPTPSSIAKFDHVAYLRGEKLKPAKSGFGKYVPSFGRGL